MKYRIWGVIDDDRDACLFFECSDISTFFTDDAPFEVIALELDGRLRGLSCHGTSVLLHRVDEDFSADIFFTDYGALLF
jgi:hypothetical protein